MNWVGLRLDHCLVTFRIVDFSSKTCFRFKNTSVKSKVRSQQWIKFQLKKIKPSKDIGIWFRSNLVTRGSLLNHLDCKVWPVSISTKKKERSLSNYLTKIIQDKIFMHPRQEGRNRLKIWENKDILWYKIVLDRLKIVLVPTLKYTLQLTLLNKWKTPRRRINFRTWRSHKNQINPTQNREQSPRALQLFIGKHLLILFTITTVCITCSRW